MKKLAFAAVLALLCCLQTFAQTTTTVTGTFRDLTGAVIPTGQVTFELKPAVDTTIAGYARFTPQTVSCAIAQSQNATLTRDGAGNVSAVFSVAQTFVVGDVVNVQGWTDSSFDGTFTLATVADSLHATWAQAGSASTATGGYLSALRSSPGPSACTITQSTAITPQNTFYQVCVWPNFARTSCFNFYALTNSVDLSAVMPAPGQTPAYPSLPSSINTQQGGSSLGAASVVNCSTNLTCTNSNGVLTIVAAGGTGCTVGGSSGSLQKNNGSGGCGPSILTDSGANVTGYSINGVQYVDCVHYGCDQTGIQNAINALPSCQGGTYPHCGSVYVFPAASTYTMTAGVTFGPYVQLHFFPGSTVDYTSGGTPFTCSDAPTSYVGDGGIYDLNLVGTSSGTAGITNNECTWFHIEHTFVSGFTNGDGILYVNTQRWTEQSTWIDVHSQSNLKDYDFIDDCAGNTGCPSFAYSHLYHVVATPIANDAGFILENDATLNHGDLDISCFFTQSSTCIDLLGSSEINGTRVWVRGEFTGGATVGTGISSVSGTEWQPLGPLQEHWTVGSGSITDSIAGTGIGYVFNAFGYGQIIGSPTGVFVGSTSNGFGVTFDVHNVTGFRTWTLPDASDTAVGRATTDSLSNKTMATSLLAQNGVDLGSTSNPFRNLYLFGSGTYGTGSWEFAGTPTANRILTLPDATGTVCLTTTCGGVSSVIITGTANQIAVSGTCTITATGTCTVGLPSGGSLPGTWNLGNPSAIGLSNGSGLPWAGLTGVLYSNITALWNNGGTCSSTTFLRGDGECQTPSGGGTVTDGSGTTTAGQLAESTTTAHVQQYVTANGAAVGLGSVTNDAQTKAAIMPNTAPSAGQIPVGNSGGTAYTPQTVSGDGTLSSTGALSITKTGGVAFAPSATTDTTNAANIGSGTLSCARTPPLTGHVTTSGCATTVSLTIPMSCEIVWGGTNTGNALQSGDDAIVDQSCYNKKGVTETITAVYCRSDAASNTTTVNPTFGTSGTGTTILSGALTCGSSGAYSSTGTVTNASLTDGSNINPVMGGTLTGTSIHILIEYTVPQS